MNLFSEEMRRNPYPAYDQLRSAAPLLYQPSKDFWMIFDYENVKRALADHETFSSAIPAPPWFIFFDPPRHTKLRALINRAFTPAVIASLEPRIRGLARMLVDQTIERGAMDLAMDFSVPLPMMVIAEMLGIPVADRARLSGWADNLLTLSHDLLGGQAAINAVAEYSAATAEMSEYLKGLIEDCRKAPRDDLLTRLDAAEVGGERLGHAEILGFFQLLLIGGTETTTNLINNAILCFIEHPEQIARLRERMELLPSAIEEVLRYRSPLQWMPRKIRREVQMHGQTIPAGKTVLAVIGSANCDPKIFPNAGKFDIARDPNPHIAFGHGIHFCLGAPLARLEARVALAELLERVKDFRLASDAPWEPRKPLQVLGPSRLPIRFEPGKRLAGNGESAAMGSRAVVAACPPCGS